MMKGPGDLFPDRDELHDTALDRLLESADPVRQAPETSEPARRALTAFWQAERAKVVRHRRIAVRSAALAAVVVLCVGAGWWSRSVEEVVVRGERVAMEPHPSPPPASEQAASPDAQASTSGRTAGDAGALPDERPTAEGESRPSPTAEAAGSDAGADQQRALRARRASRGEDIFAAEMIDAWSRGSQAERRQVVARVARGGPRAVQQIQRELTSAESAERQAAALELIAAVVGREAMPLLGAALAAPELRSAAWPLLVAVVRDEELRELVDHAANLEERHLLCQSVARRLGPGAADALVDLALTPSYRDPAADAAAELSDAALVRLVQLLEETDGVQRAAVGFLLAEAEAPQLDAYLIERVLSGRSRQAALMALMVRRTPESQRFIEAAAARWDLAAACHSAWQSYQRWGSVVGRWQSSRVRQSDERVWNCETDSGWIAAGDGAGPGRCPAGLG